MRTSTGLLAAALVAVVIGSPAVTEALDIVPNYATFNAADRSIIDEAIREWEVLLPCTDGHAITVTFVCDNNLGDLGETSNWVTDAQGRPTSATVTIDNDAHNWTLGPPAAGRDDALDTLKHEVGHAIGFTVILDNFANHVRTVSGNRFFDMNGNGAFDNDDFDLTDDPADGTHAPADSGDLMQPTTPKGQRHHPTLDHARVLGRAFGYTVIPEPATLCLLGLGALAALRRRRR